MSSPIHLDDDIYAPPWARERILPVAEPPPRSRANTVDKMSPQKLKPKFSGDRAVMALQRQLARHPDLIPEPSVQRNSCCGSVALLLWPFLSLGVSRPIPA